MKYGIDKEEIVYPVVHLNGTGKNSLISEYEKAGHAVSMAIKTMQENCPNARDYYLIPGSFKEAMEQHTDRILRLKSVFKEIETILDNIDEQG